MEKQYMLIEMTCFIQVFDRDEDVRLSIIMYTNVSN